MSKTLKPYQPVHTLSEKFRRLRRNFFVWNQRLVGGLHLDEKNPISISTFYRWCSLMINEDTTTATRSFELRPVEVHPSTMCFFNYLVTSWGRPLDSTSDAPLVPGDFGTFRASTYSDDTEATKVLPFGREHASFTVQREWYDANRFPMPDSLVESVRTRDQSRCVITGSSVDDASSVVTWIYPPCIPAREEYLTVDSNGKPITLPPDMTRWLSVSNALTLRRDVAELFSDNKLGVDIDDNFRIVLFGPSADYAQVSLLTHLDLSRYGLDARPNPQRLRENFLHCLLVNFCGRDITKIYERVSPTDFFEERGVYDGQAVFKDPEWQTELGKEAMEMLLRSRLLGSDDRQKSHKSLDSDEE